jgi:tRNA pseudouridine13 synthase
MVRQLEVTDRQALAARLESIKTDGVPNYFGPQRFGREGQNYHKACELIADPELRSRRKLDRKQKDIYVSALRSWLFNDCLVREVEADNWSDDDDLWVYGLSPHRDIDIPAVDDEYRDAAEFIEAIGVKAHQRAKRMLPSDMSWQFQDDSLQLSFSLPVGAYATTLLEEVLEIKDAQL